MKTNKKQQHIIKKLKIKANNKQIKLYVWYNKDNSK